ncbi:MAG TPA: hydroxymethylglutaryl-CoA lyase [Acidimicrobiales bacterium]|nr:hydroxymethylglutaryl-CoA lyase [Acidimicrobiales bacterium]
MSTAGGAAPSRALELVEVSPRDGLQDEPGHLPTEAKVALIERALDAGLNRVEAVSFVRPDRVPAMADAEEVMSAVSRRPGSRLSGLVLNERGLERALSAGVDEINVAVLVTETFSRRNQGMGVDRAVAMWSRVASEAGAAGIGASVTLSAAFGCPYEGVVEPRRVRELARRVAGAGALEIGLADTIGCAVPPEVGALVRDVAADTRLPVRVHLHNSRNTGYANAVAAVGAGVAALDASIGGIGGCPFAPGAAGNIASEDLVHLLDRMGITTGVRLEGLLQASRWLAEELGHPLPGQVVRSGPFPIHNALV